MILCDLHASGELFLAAAAGGLLGGFFFGSLWWVVRRVPAMRHPQWSLLVSFAVRSAAVILGILWISGGRWERIVACLAGFVLARGLFTTWLLPRETKTRAKVG